MDYRPIIESRYNRARWQELLHDIFRNRAKFWEQPRKVLADEKLAKQALYIGEIKLPDGHVIAIYEVELSDSVIIERNRAGIRNLLCSNWRGLGCSGAFMFCFRENESVLRFSYISESYKFKEDGSMAKESTDTKRFTYLLGEGHRSRTAIQQFEDLKKSALDLKAVTKAFSVEALSDLFFKEYKKRYEDIIEYVTGKRMVKVANKWEERVTGDPCLGIMQEFSRFPDAEKAVRDYVKKLMGRLVFIQFLQKKGWMGCPAGDSWENGDREFVQNLFANTSHKETFIDDVLEPLFDDINTKHEGDLSSNANVGLGIKIPYLNGGLFEKDEYDKTAFPLPSKYMKDMLDFFASYNFTIDENDPDDAEIGVDPEMLGRIFENLLEDNKDKGAFYTPKEIVQYMCRESLIAYLATDIEEEYIKDSIRRFVTTHDVTVLDEQLKATIDQRLKDVKICDPAIGSGAFPMGLLRELYACRKAIEDINDEKAVSIKSDIIQNNIYGVDIEKGAVDIARLRFWLALIVDEKTPHALPNMDFKIMQGNSLLEQYEGVDLSTVTDLKTERKETTQLSIFEDEVDLLRRELRNLLNEYYGCSDQTRKAELRTEISDNVKKQLKEQQIKVDFGDLDLLGNDQFFLWHTWFHDVFSKGGFDIVIGNPPYVSSKEIPLSDKKIYKQIFQTAKKQFDLYSIFIERGLAFLKDNGITSYIVPDSIIGRSNFDVVRKKLVLDNTIKQWVHLNNVFDSATVSSLIYVCSKKRKLSYSFTYIKAENVKKWINQIYDSMLIESKLIKQDPIAKIYFANTHELKLQQRLMDSKTFSSMCTIWRGEEIGKKSGTILNQYTNDCYPLITGSETKRYAIPKPNKWIKKVNVSKSLNNYHNHKILIRQIGERINATIDENNGITTQSVYSLYPKSNLDMRHLTAILGVLNSKLFDFFYHLVAGDKQMFKRIILENIKALPYPNLNSPIVPMLDELIKSFLNKAQDGDINISDKEERKIDRLVYQLYGLTNAEVRIIDPNEPISGSDDEPFKA